MLKNDVNSHFWIELDYIQFYLALNKCIFYVDNMFAYNMHLHFYFQICNPTLKH